MMIQFENYGQERDLICTEQEREMFEILVDMTGREELRLVRKCDDYVTAVLGEWDLARFKYTTRAKWITFPCMERGGTKNRIQSPEEVRQFADLAAESIAHIDKYQN